MHTFLQVACSEGPEPMTSSQIRVACILFCSIATCQVMGAASPFASADLPPLIRWSLDSPSLTALVGYWELATESSSKQGFDCDARVTHRSIARFVKI
jgi:hypothetical protein